MELLQKKNVRIAVNVILGLFALLLLLINLNAVNNSLGALAMILRPVLIGLSLAYLLNPVFRFFEGKIFFGVYPRGLRRVLALIFTYLFLFLLISILFFLIVPQLASSVETFLEHYESYLDTAVSQANGMIASINNSIRSDRESGPISPLNAAELKESAKKLLEAMDLKDKSVLEYVTAENLLIIFRIAGNVVSFTMDLIFSFFVSLYFLATKEKRYAQVMRMRHALFDNSINARITRFCTVADQSFGGFIRGKLLDSTIVGILVYCTNMLLGIPYALLIATIVGITDFIPVVGPFIGVIPSAVIILLTDPPKVIFFLLAILVIQQIDGNIIAPKILGDNTGVSSLCVIIAISVMGSIFGLIGMLIGVPLFATILELANSVLNRRLKNKGLYREDEDGRCKPKKKKRLFRRQENTEKRSYVLYAAGYGAGDLSADETDALSAYDLYSPKKQITRTETDFPKDAEPARDADAEEENQSTGNGIGDKK